MELQDLQHECAGCGRTFMHTNAFNQHQRSCKKSKARLSSALTSARENWRRLKKARISGPDLQPSNSPASSSGHGSISNLDIILPENTIALPDPPRPLSPSITAILTLETVKVEEVVCNYIIYLRIINSLITLFLARTKCPGYKTYIVTQTSSRTGPT